MAHGMDDLNIVVGRDGGAAKQNQQEAQALANGAEQSDYYREREQGINDVWIRFAVQFHHVLSSIACDT
jgi:hypothetical protein